MGKRNISKTWDNLQDSYPSFLFCVFFLKVFVEGNKKADKVCYGLNCAPPKSYVEALISNVMVLVGGAFGR